MGLRGGEAKGTLFRLEGGEESRLGKAHWESDQQSQRHSVSARGRNGGKMGGQSADSELEWNGSGIRSRTAVRPCPLPLTRSAALVGLLTMGVVILALQVVQKIRANLRKAPVTLKLS